MDRFHWLCHAYCLKDNHCPLLVETQEANLSRGMRQLNGVYTRGFHRTHERVGHLFQGPYKAIVVEKEAHLLELCRYLVWDPVRAGMVKRAKDWRWSSYRAAAGLDKVPEFLTVDWIGGQFSRGRRAGCRLYQAFVAEGAGQKSPWGSLKWQIFWGGEGFTDALKESLEGAGKIKEVPRAQRCAGRPLGENLSLSGHQGRREQAIYQADIEYGYTMKEIAEPLEVHYTTVSKIIKSEKQRKL